MVAMHVYSLAIFRFIPACLVFVCVSECAHACTGMAGIMFMSDYLGESKDTVMMELILLGMRLGSCCNTHAVVLLF